MAKLDDTLKSANHQKALVIQQNTIDIFFMIFIIKKISIVFCRMTKAFW